MLLNTFHFLFSLICKCFHQAIGVAVGCRVVVPPAWLVTPRVLVLHAVAQGALLHVLPHGPYLFAFLC